MDYTIISPEQVTQYDQTWILTRSTRALDITKVKSVSIEKKWLLRSIFNYWTIIFFSEGDAALWDVRLNYINDPIKLRDMITEMVKMWVYKKAEEAVSHIEWNTEHTHSEVVTEKEINIVNEIL